jgi:hypothetical protein
LIIFHNSVMVAIEMILNEPEDPIVCISCQYGSVRACPRRQEAMRRGFISSQRCARKQELTWRNRTEKIDVKTNYDFSLRNCRRTLGVASYEKVRIYIGSIYAKNSSKKMFVRKLIELELHEMLHSVLDKLSIAWWRSENRIKKCTDLLYEALCPYLDEYWGMWYCSVPSRKK